MNTTLTAESCLLLSTRLTEFSSVRLLQKEFGFKGLSVTIFILTEVAKHGKETRYDNRFKEAVARLFPDISVNLVNMIVRRMVQYGLLDHLSFVGSKMISVVPQSILKNMTELESKKDDSFPYYVISSEETRVISEETPINTEEITDNSCSPLNNTAYGTTKEARP